MKMRTMLILVLVLISLLLGSSIGMAMIPAEGFDPDDSIYIKAETAYYWEGRYSNDRIWSEYLAKELTGDFDKLINYAVGGAFTGVLTGSIEEGTDRSNWSTWLKGWGGVEQTEIFATEVNGVADPGALYVISTGSNDEYTVGSLGIEGTTQKSAENIVIMIDNLAKAGAKDFIVTLLTTTPGKTETAFCAAHRAATEIAINTYAVENEAVNIIIVDFNNLYRDMEAQGKEAYGFKTWNFYLISDWVPAYGYVYAANDNSNFLPTNAMEDIYGYGYYYSIDSGYYTPEAANYDVNEFLYYDEYHLTNKTHMHLASYILDSDLTTHDGIFQKVYDGVASAFAISPLVEKTYSMIYTFGDSTIDSGRALEVTAQLVEDREIQSKSILDMTDAKTDQWYTTYVNYVLQTGFMKGVTIDSFGPDEPITRGQFVSILGRASGIEDSATGNLAEFTFEDVDSSAYYASHVAWAVEKGIINGVSATFAPNKNISRQDMAKIIEIYAEVADMELSEVSILMDYNNALHPPDYTTRAEAAKVLAILLNY